MTLDAWMPLLVRAWRERRGAAGDADAPLSREERRQLLRGAARLTAGLTGERALVGERYFEEPELLGAYLFLYWPVSFAQAQVVLGELGATLSGPLLDVGSGPGPMALAALSRGASAALCLDRSPAALAVAARLAALARVSLTTARWTPPLAPDPEVPPRLIIAGHLLNELPSAAARLALASALLARLSDDGVLVLIEPALRTTSRALLTLRDALVERGHGLVAPCLFRGGCPALAREADWCHAQLPFSPPPLVAELAEAARLHRDELKMSYLIVTATGRGWPAPPPGRPFRIVSAPLPQKGQHRLVGCGPEGRLPLVLPTKHESEANRDFLSLVRGDVADIDPLTPRGDGLRLGTTTRVARLAAPGEPLPPRPLP